MTTMRPRFDPAALLGPWDATERRARWVLDEAAGRPAFEAVLTDDSLRVRQVTHYQFSWTAGEGGQSGTWTLQLPLLACVPS